MLENYTSTPVRVYTESDLTEAHTMYAEAINKHAQNITNMKSEVCSVLDTCTIVKTIDEIRIEDIIQVRTAFDACSPAKIQKTVRAARKSVEDVYDALGLYLEVMRALYETRMPE